MELSAYEFGVLSCGAVIAGIWLLVVSGDRTVAAAVSIARRARLSPVFIGATIVAFGTSVPELVTSVNANLQGYPGLSLGNVVGSNIANVLLVIGAAALVCCLTVEFSAIRRDLGLMLVATTLLVGGMLHGVFSPTFGAAMFLLLVGFLAWQYFGGRIEPAEGEDDGDHRDEPSWRCAAWLLAGLAGLTVGSEILVIGAVGAGRVLGVPEAVIGVTVVALGTSLPELTASIASALRRETGLLIGAIVGSNSFNILSIVAVTAMIEPLTVAPALAGVDMWVMVAAAVGLAAWLAVFGRIGRPVGAALLVGYAVFTVAQFVGGSGFDLHAQPPA